MSAWTDARDNVRSGVASTWAGMSPQARSLTIGLAIGFALGAFAVGVLLC